MSHRFPASRESNFVTIISQLQFSAISLLFATAISYAHVDLIIITFGCHLCMYLMGVRSHSTQKNTPVPICNQLFSYRL